MINLPCHILDTGYCLASEHHLLQGGRRETIQCHSIVALLQHPTQGWIMWDAGYAPRMIDATRRLPFWLYRLITPLHIKEELSAVNQLARFGLKADDIRHIIISHFHADHISGLRDFPHAHFIASRRAYESVKTQRGLNALRRAFIPDLMPNDFEERLTLIDRFGDAPLPAIGNTHDLFGDGTLQLMNLPGHARGQIGLLADTDRGQILFAADGAWLSKSIRTMRPPSSITNLIADDATAVQTTLNSLYAFSLARPQVTIIPTHCPETFARYVI